MTDKSSILKAFNTHFFEFVEDIINIFPENNDIKDSKTALEFFKKANPTSILKAWNFFVYTPYREVINQGNIEFFFDKDYKNDLTYMSNANEIVKVIDTLREPVKNMGDANKEHTMKYIQNISKLSDMYLAMK